MIHDIQTHQIHIHIHSHARSIVNRCGIKKKEMWIKPLKCYNSFLFCSLCYHFTASLSILFFCHMWVFFFHSFCQLKRPKMIQDTLSAPIFNWVWLLRLSFAVIIFDRWVCLCTCWYDKREKEREREWRVQENHLSLELLLNFFIFFFFLCFICVIKWNCILFNARLWWTLKCIMMLLCIIFFQISDIG